MERVCNEFEVLVELDKVKKMRINKLVDLKTKLDDLSGFQDYFISNTKKNLRYNLAVCNKIENGFYLFQTIEFYNSFTLFISEIDAQRFNLKLGDSVLCGYYYRYNDDLFQIEDIAVINDNILLDTKSEEFKSTKYFKKLMGLNEHDIIFNEKTLFDYGSTNYFQYKGRLKNIISEIFSKICVKETKFVLSLTNLPLRKELNEINNIFAFPISYYKSENVFYQMWAYFLNALRRVELGQKVHIIICDLEKILEVLVERYSKLGQPKDLSMLNAKLFLKNILKLQSMADSKGITYYFVDTDLQEVKEILGE